MQALSVQANRSVLCSGSIMSRILKLFAFVLVLGILPQCSEKGSDQYVTEGIEYTNLQRYDEAIHSFQKAIETNPKNARAYYGLGGIYNYKKMYPQAEEAFQTVIRLDPVHYDAFYSLGFTYETMGDKENAEKNYRRYRELKEKMDVLLEKEKKNR